MSDEKKFRIPFFGFVYVLAESAEEALEKLDDDEFVYYEKGYGDAEEVDDFAVIM